MMKILNWMVLGVVLSTLGACENEKNTFSDTPAIYLGGDAEQEATADSVLFSFKKMDDSATSFDLNLKVYTTGNTTAHNRPFELEVVEEKSNVDASAYTIGNMELPADSYMATVPVTIRRNVAGLDLSKEMAYLTLRVKSNGNFEEGPEEYAEYKLAWCDYLIPPAWWGARSSMVYYAGPFTQARYKFILDYYGDIDLLKEGIVDESGYSVDDNVFYSFIAELIDLLNEYNSTHDTPYLNDNGEPLAFGANLKN